jgi:hypothetical protein
MRRMPETLTNSEDTPMSGTPGGERRRGTADLQHRRQRRQTATITNVATGAFTTRTPTPTAAIRSPSRRMTARGLEHRDDHVSITLNDAPAASAGSVTTNEDVVASALLAATDITPTR